LLPLVRERNSSVLEYLKEPILVIDEPSGIDSFLGDVYQSLTDRFNETDAADDLGLAPEELYLTPAELRAKLDQRPRLELRTLGRAAANVDQELQLDAEAPQVQLGRSRARRRPLFLFPSVGTVPENEWKSQSVMRYHGRLADLAADLARSGRK